MRKFLGIVAGAVLALAVIGLPLNQTDYRIFWMDPNGTVIAGLTSAGRLDTLAGANIGGAVSVAGNISHTTATNSGAVMVSVGTVTYQDTTAKDLFVLPANAYVVDVVTVVTEAFTDTGTDLLIVGTADDDDKWVDDLDGSAAGVLRTGGNATMPYAGLGSVGSEAVTVQGKYTGQNGNAGAGSMTVYLYWHLP